MPSKDPDYFKRYYRLNKDKRQANDRFRRYGITQEQYDELLKNQDYKCRICKIDKADNRGGSWHTDHDHKTGIVRSLLCSCCNSMLGHAKDDPEILKQAATYLELQYVAY
jgi:hypothetical protein